MRVSGGGKPRPSRSPVRGGGYGRGQFPKSLNAGVARGQRSTDLSFASCAEAAGLRLRRCAGSRPRKAGFRASLPQVASLVSPHPGSVVAVDGRTRAGVAGRLAPTGPRRRRASRASLGSRVSGGSARRLPAPPPCPAAPSRGAIQKAFRGGGAEAAPAQASVSRIPWQLQAIAPSSCRKGRGNRRRRPCSGRAFHSLPFLKVLSRAGGVRFRSRGRRPGFKWWDGALTMGRRAKSKPPIRNLRSFSRPPHQPRTHMVTWVLMPLEPLGACVGWPPHVHFGAFQCFSFIPIPVVETRRSWRSRD